MGLAANANHLSRLLFPSDLNVGVPASSPLFVSPGDSCPVTHGSDSVGRWWLTVSFLMKMRVKNGKVQSEFTRSKFRTEAKGDLALPFWTLRCGEKKTLRFISFESSMTEYRWYNVEVISNQWGFFFLYCLKSLEEKKKSRYRHK